MAKHKTAAHEDETAAQHDLALPSIEERIAMIEADVAEIRQALTDNQFLAIKPEAIAESEAPQPEV